MSFAVDKEQVVAILRENGPFRNEEDSVACLKLVEELTLDEQETAARSSYVYWLATYQENYLESFDRSELRTRFAMREARRHYVGEGRSEVKARVSLNEAISLRSQFRMDLIRKIPEADSIDLDKSMSEEDKEMVKKYRGYVEHELKKQLTISSGTDRDNRAVVIRFPRVDSATEQESFMVTQLYIAERGFAATEFLTVGKDEKVMVILEFADYSSTNSPPLSLITDCVLKVQKMYPERLKKLVIHDPPFFVRTFYNLLYPFLSKTTRDKVALVSGVAGKKDTLTTFIDVSTSLPLMKEWKLSSDSVNLDYYLSQYMHETYQPPTQNEVCVIPS